MGNDYQKNKLVVAQFIFIISILIASADITCGQERVLTTILAANPVIISLHDKVLSRKAMVDGLESDECGSATTVAGAQIAIENMT